MSNPRPRPQVLTITDAAVARLKTMMAANAQAAGLKIGIKKGGCAGMEYTLQWAEAAGKFDEVVERDGVRVIIDPQAVLYLLGTEMDYKVESSRRSSSSTIPTSRARAVAARA